MTVKEFAFLGHPDKFADLIADLLVDHCLRRDPNAKCAFEVMVKGDVYEDEPPESLLYVVVSGETTEYVPEAVVRRAVRYACVLAHVEEPDRIEVTLHLSAQSRDIASNSKGVVGDQTVVVGMSVAPNHSLAVVRRLEMELLPSLQQSRGFREGRSVGWDGDGKAMFVGQRLVSLSVGGKEFLPSEDLLDLMAAHSTTLNPPNRNTWAGGPVADCGMTNRKLACDAHGLYAPHGGGGLSGKDLSKPDRGGRIIADYLADKLRGGRQSMTVTLVYEMGNNMPVHIGAVDDCGNANRLKLATLLKPYPELLADALGGRKFSAVEHCHPWLARGSE